MTRIPAAVAALLIALPGGIGGSLAAGAQESWRLGPAPSDHADLMAATVTNADGHTVYLWSLTGDTAHQVFGELHLAEGQAFGDAMPTYRIDDRATVDTGDIRDAGDAQNALWGHVGRQAAFWLISVLSAQGAPSDAALEPWLDGRELLVSFRDSHGVERTTRFTLAGSEQAIRGATGLAPR